MPRSRKCSVCERRVNKSQKHVVDLDTGRRFHVKCYVGNYGDLPKNVKTVSENSICGNPTRQDLIEGIKDEKEGAAKYKQWADEYYQKGDYGSAELMNEFANDEIGHKAGLKGLALSKAENPKIIAQEFENILAMKDHGDVMLMRGNEGVYRWDANLGAWKPEEKFLTEYSGFNPSPIRSQFALQSQTRAEIENPMKYAEGSYEKLPYGKYIRERQIDPEVFDPRSFRTRKTKTGHALIFGCPAGQWDAKNAKCRVATKLQSILHPMREASEKRFAKLWKSHKVENITPHEHSLAMEMLARGKTHVVILPPGMGENLYTNSFTGAKEMAKEYGKGTHVMTIDSFLRQNNPITEEQKQHVKKFASALGKMKNPIKRNAYFHKLRDHMQQSALHYQMGDKNNAAKHYFQGFGLWQGLTKPEIARFGREAPVEFDWYNKGYMMFGGAENPIGKLVQLGTVTQGIPIKLFREASRRVEKRGGKLGKVAHVHGKMLDVGLGAMKTVGEVAGSIGEENAIDMKPFVEAGKSVWKFLNTPEGKKIAAAAAKAGKDVFEMAAKAMSKTTAKVSNPEMNLIIGNKIKKALGVMRVIKRYHNKHRDGSGNFGYTIVAPSTKAFMGKYEEWFTLDGSYDSAGNSHRLTFATFSGSNRISIPEAATYDQLVAAMKSFITEMTGAKNPIPIALIITIALPIIQQVGGKVMDKWDSMSVQEREVFLEKLSKSKAAMAAGVAYAATTFGTGAVVPLALAALKSKKVRSTIANMNVKEMQKTAKESGAVDVAKSQLTKQLAKAENPEIAHLKHFSDPDTGKDWAETNKVDVLDIYYSPEVGQYVVKYRGFPVVDEKHTSDAVVTEENPSSMPKAMHVARMLMESEE